MRIRRTLGIAVALAAAAGSPPSLLAQTADGVAAGGSGENATIDVEAVPRPVATAHRVSAAVRIDGRLDEPAWAEADSITGFVQSQPNPGYPATEPTLVRILYDESALYIGAMLFDSEPGSMVVSTLEHDFPGESTRDYDIFGITLDTFDDRRDSFIYLVNPRGALRDGQTFDDSRTANFAWDGVSQVETQIHDWGWSLEMAIPWTSLRFDPTRQEQVFGLNVLRRVRRKNEDSYWAPLDRRDPVHRMSKAGRLVGIRGLRPGRNLSITPYVAAGTGSRGPGADGADRGSVDGGADLKYGLTPKLTLDLTYRTDFSQVEVDQERVNLTRFSLFFPEKRGFFVENSGVFTFGDVSEREYRMGASLRDFTLFHSRRIGLADGHPVPIVGGGRMTGRLGAFDVGILNMQTESTAATSAENFSVARVRRSVGPLEVGGMAINRQATDGTGSYNRSWGVDLNGRFLGSLIVSSYLAGTHEPDDRSGLAMRSTAAWRDRLWDVSAMHKRVGSDFDPGVGFVRRRGMNHTYGTVGAHPRPDLPLVQQVNPFVEGDYITGPGNRLETRRGTAGVRVTFTDGGTVDADVSDKLERLDTPFPVGSGVVPPGGYAFQEGSVRYRSSAGRPISAGVAVSGGEFFDGERLSVGTSAAWRASYRLSLDVTADHNRIDLPGSRFTADVYGARLRYSHSKALFGSAFVQYNEAAEQLVTNVRLNLIHAPLSNLFLVYTERRGIGGAETGVLERLLSAKITKMLAF